MLQGKALIKSKVFWFSCLYILIAIANYFGFDSFKPDDRLSGLVEMGISILAGLVSIFLRTQTDQPIKSLT
jgi:hypothetical protein